MRELGAFSPKLESERFSSVIAADLIGRKAKVKAVDNRIAQDAQPSAFKAGTRLAATILLYSLERRKIRALEQQEVCCRSPLTGTRLQLL